MEHAIELTLASDAQLTLRLFSETEHCWQFKYRYRQEEDRDVRLINDVTFTIRYVDGRIQPVKDATMSYPVSLTMHIIVPERLGKQYLYGMDISPGAKTFLEFEYEFVEGTDTLQLRELRAGIGKHIDFNEVEPALVKQVEFPFPVLDRIEPKYGVYTVPFLRYRGDDTDGQDYFEFPFWTAAPIDRSQETS